MSNSVTAQHTAALLHCLLQQHMLIHHTSHQLLMLVQVHTKMMETQLTISSVAVKPSTCLYGLHRNSCCFMKQMFAVPSSLLLGGHCKDVGAYAKQDADQDDVQAEIALGAHLQQEQRHRQRQAKTVLVYSWCQQHQDAPGTSDKWLRLLANSVHVITAAAGCRCV